MSPVLKYLLEGGGAIAAARGLWYIYTWWMARRDAQEGRRAIEGRGEIATTLEELIDRTPADYAHIIRIHNGGGDLEAGLPIFMTCIQEEHRPGFPPLKNEVAGIELDKHSRKMVAKLIDEKDAAYPVAELKDELLQAVFSAMQAKYARAIILRVGKKGIFFLRTTSSREALDDQQFQLCYRKAVSQLRKHYR